MVFRLPFVLLVAGILSLIMTGTAHARCFGVPETEPGDVLWSVPLTATSAVGDVDGAAFGSARGATNFFDEGLDESEPRPTEDVRLRLFFFLDQQVLGFPPIRFNQSFVAPSDRMTWTLTTEYRGEQPARLTLTWDAEEVKEADDKVTLSLLDGPLSVDMLSTSSYSYDVSPGTSSFVIVGEPREGTTPALLTLVLFVGGYLGVVVIYIVLRRRRRRRGN